MRRHSLPAPKARYPLRSSLLVSISASLLMGACVGNDDRPDLGDPATEQVPELAAPADSKVEHPAADSARVAQHQAAVAQDSGAHALATDHPRAPFEATAFPPTLPFDDNHRNAWLRDDCILCHENGIAKAPLVQHAGMSSALLGARCRTCHVVSPPPVPGEVNFARRAFPPTLPADPSHDNAWLRDDCLQCHATGVDSAPKVIHQGMADLLLKARCRSCHLPGATGTQTD